MTRMLLSIKPEYVDKILVGKKKYEFRKFRCRKDVDTIVIYETAPVKRVVGEAKIVGIVEGSPEDVWRLTCLAGGITEEAFMEYYRNKNVAIAYELGKVTVYDKPMSLLDMGLSYVPQSFAYI